MLFFYLFGLSQIVLSFCDIRLKYIQFTDNQKAYKKILKTHKNVLTIYSKDEKSVLDILRYSEDVAKEIRGRGTIVFINCGKNKEAKKLCKKYNVNPMPRSLKHYKDGSFHKDYDRKDNAKSLLNFMLDPTGDAPWEEDPNAKNIVHINNEKDFNRQRRNEKGPMLVMFYAPWCGYCKKLKPQFAQAATHLKGKSVLVGVDVEKAENQNLRYQFNITGYPTLIYFENGETKFPYGGAMDKEGIIDWMGNPQAPEEKKPETEDSWAEEATEILHLTDSTFPDALKEQESMMIMFYAPWCGHCKKMKPEYVEAAKTMREQEISGTLAAVDCTKEQGVCKQFDVSGYPTVKYFAEGEMKFDVNTRTKDAIVDFMMKPEEPPPPPPEDLPWHEVSGPEIIHLTDDTFKDELKKKKHVLVMFYAPWCGHCKKAKPEFVEAAEHFKDNRKVYFAGIDCTEHQKSCSQYDVTGYPTFRYFQYGKKDFLYGGGRNTEAFIKFMDNPTESNSKEPSSEQQWKDIPSGVVHLTDDDFDQFITSHASVLVMFYAPWCGHCKNMKPAYMDASNALLDTTHVLAAVDCTVQVKTAAKYDISGYPTLKYFDNGVASDYESGRSKEELTHFFYSKDGSPPPKPKVVWEDDEAETLIHLNDNTFEDFIKENNDVFVMFYAPWCGHCKRMKPDYVKAAEVVNKEGSEIKGKLAAFDCTANPVITTKYGIRGYPTLKFFRDGKEFTKYKGQRTVEALLEFMKNPTVAPTEPPTVEWSVENQDVVHLTGDTFESYMKEHPSVMVMFYAPWCGHCKRMKPEYAAAAKIINVEKKVEGKLVALDCTKHKEICTKYEVKGYPTVKYFKDGEEAIVYRGPRTKDEIMKFMESPSAVPTPESNQSWEQEPSEIHHLNDENFQEFLKKHNALVMFYAPWCGHCKSMKPSYVEAAKTLKMENSQIKLAAIDAQKYREIADKEEVKGYPTLKYYKNGVFVQEYQHGRSTQELLAYIRKRAAIESGKEAAALDETKFENIPSSVKHLASDTFHPHLKKYPAALVMFHKEACKKCKKSQQEFMQASSRLSFSEKASFAAVSCDTYKDLCPEQDSDKLPIIQFYKSGKFEEIYSSEILADRMVRYIISKQQKEEL